MSKFNNNHKHTMGLEDLSVLVIGYDGYSDVWVHFVYFINKYWKNRPNTYFATSELNPVYENITVIPSGTDAEWSKKVLTGLEKIKTKYVLLLLEDFFITDYVDNNEVIKIIDFVKNNDIKFYQLMTPHLHKWFIRGKQYTKDKHILAKNKKCRYGLNCQAAIWNTNFLCETIGMGNYNAWVFECNNLHRENYNENKIEYVVDTRNILHLLHAIVQGKYLPSAIKKCNKCGYIIDTNQREAMSYQKYIIYRLKQVVTEIIPDNLINIIKRLLRHLNFSFVTDKWQVKNK